MTGGRHLGLVGIAIAVLMASSVLLYSVLPIAGIALGVSSGVVATVVIVHLGALAAAIGPLVALRRRARGRRS